LQLKLLSALNLDKPCVDDSESCVIVVKSPENTPEKEMRRTGDDRRHIKRLKALSYNGLCFSDVLFLNFITSGTFSQVELS